MSEEKTMTLEELQAEITKGVEAGMAKMQAPTAKLSKKEAKEKMFAEAKEFLVNLVDGKVEKKDIDTSSGSYGYSIPTTLADAILEKRDKLSKIRKYAFVFKMNGNFQLPTQDDGATAHWVDDNDEITESTPTLLKKDLVDYYLACRILIPRKLLNGSAYNLVSFLGNLCAREIRNAEETAFVAGNGSLKPTGIRTASITSDDQAGANLVYDDLVNLYYMLKEQYRVSGCFLTSTAGCKLIRSLKDDYGIPIFDPRDNTVFGRPLLESEDIPSNLGSGINETEIYFADLSYYWIKDGEALFADTDKVLGKLQTELVVAEAVDGCVVNEDAFVKLTAVK